MNYPYCRCDITEKNIVVPIIAISKIASPLFRNKTIILDFLGATGIDFNDIAYVKVDIIALQEIYTIRDSWVLELSIDPILLHKFIRAGSFISKKGKFFMPLPNALDTSILRRAPIINKKYKKWNVSHFGYYIKCLYPSIDMYELKGIFYRILRKR